MGKKSAPAPDYTPVAKASEQAATLSNELGREYLAENRRQYDDSKVALKPIVDAQLGIMEQTKEQGKDYYDYNKSTFRPVEEGLVRDANAFSTEGAKEQFARDAVVDLESAQANEEAQTNRAAAAMGVNPNSGKFAAIKSVGGLRKAADRAGAMTRGRISADQLSVARRMDVSGLGRNLPGASVAAYSAATGAGNSASGNTMAPGAQLMSGMAQGNATIMGGQQMAIGGLGSVLNAQTIYANANKGDSLGSLVATGIGAYGALKPSDRRLKENIVAVGKDEDTGLKLYEFNYKDIAGKRFRGVMADEVESRFPDAVKYDDLGFAAVDYGQLGIEMVEV